MTHTDSLHVLFLPLLRQYWWLVLVILAAPLLKLFSPIIKGKIGEGCVNLAAKLRLDREIYHLIKDVTIPTKKGTTQIDHVIVSVYGLFVIETKNYKGWIFANAKNKQWTQVNFKQKHRFQNPLHQNYAHICALSDLLSIPKEKIHGVVCFMGDAKFKTKVPDGVFIQGRYVGHIESFKTPLFSKDEVDDLIRQIESGRLERGIKTNRQHVQHLKKQNATEDKMRPIKIDTAQTPAISDPKICPKCGSAMVLRTARSGPNAGNQFWGCSAFPKCRSTLPATV
jgi:hypothetical protein